MILDCLHVKPKVYLDVVRGLIIYSLMLGKKWVYAMEACSISVYIHELGDLNRHKLDGVQK